MIDLDAMPRSAAIRTIIGAFLDETIGDAPWFLEMLAERAEVAVDDEAMARALFTDWDQVRRLTGPDPGCPSARTGTATRSSPGSMRRPSGPSWPGRNGSSRTGSAARLHALAYPYGWPGTYTEQTKAIAAGSGYRVAFASLEGINRPDSLDPFEVRRLGVGSGDSPILLRPARRCTPPSAARSCGASDTTGVVGSLGGRGLSESSTRKARTKVLPSESFHLEVE